MKVEKAKLVKMSGGGGGLGAVAGAAAGVGGIGGMLPVVWTKTEMNFRFNPSQLTLAKTAQYGGQSPRSSEEGGQEQFTRVGTRTLGFTVLLDEWEAPAGGDVGSMVMLLQDWCNPDPDGPRDNPEPPTVGFIWGNFQFIGRLESVSATFDLFRKDGSPARGEVVVSMKDRPKGRLGQNPTSGGPPGRRSCRLLQGDTLPSVANDQLGDPNLWRVIADMNGIDDPLAVAAGATLLVPSRQDAAVAARSAREDSS